MIVPLSLMFLLSYLSSSYIGVGIAILLLMGVIVIGRLSMGERNNCHPIENINSPGLLKEIRDLLSKAGIKGVEVKLLEDYIPNAYSRGREVVLSMGLFEILDDDEILAVVAHELGHIRNRDTILFPLVAYLRIFAFLMPVVLLVMSGYLWTVLMGYVLYIWFEWERSRFLVSREFKADDFAVRVLERPISLKHALEELKYYEDLRTKVKRGALPGIEPTIDRHTKESYQKPSFILFPTHPSYDERIVRIVEYTLNDIKISDL